ncbi:MAG: DNA polymerase III subunit beta [Oscillospiraceae bacterium]
MKFSCEKSLIQAAVTTASRAASVRSAVPSLEGLLIEAHSDVRISGYDLKTGIRTTLSADVVEEGAVVLNARLFGDIIRKMPDDIFVVDVDERFTAKIKCGMSEFEIIGFNEVDYPEFPSVDYQNSIYIQEKTLKAMIAQTNFAVSDNEARPIHTGSLFEVEDGVLTVVSVDGYRLALRREPLERTEIEKCSFVVPGTALSEVEKIASETDDLVKITQGSKHIMFTIGTTTLVSRKLEGEFLNYKNSVPTTGKYQILADRRLIVSSVERVSLIINDRLKSPVRCVFTDGLLKVYTSTALGKASDECPISGDGDGLEIGFNNKYILDALKAAPSDNIVLLISTGISPCVIVPAGGETNFIYMILPVRLKANES